MGGASAASGSGGAGGSAASSSAVASSVASSSGGNVDQDGDGWTVADGDCCDNPGDCTDPKYVNPGAFEYLGNNVDDDCDPSTLDGVLPQDCSMGPVKMNTTGDDLARAMDLCQFTTESPPLPMKKWGVVSTALLLADGAGAPNDVQVGALASYGPNVVPKKGPTLAAISSGTARTPDDPDYVHPQNGVMAGQVGNYNASTAVSAPPSYLAAHGGSLPATCGPACNGPSCTQAFDSVNLKMRIRVPTNAKSFSYNFKFYSAEYPEFLCQAYNDFFVVLLQSQWTPDPNANPPEAPLPADGDIAFDAQKNPVSVNNAFFQVCFPSQGAPAGTCPSGTLELVGTGMGGWGNALSDGGGTNWLQNDAPVVPGETVEIQFVLWDAGDHNVDSLALLDKWRWNVTPASVGTHK
jgi:hypothetical protein